MFTKQCVAKTALSNGILRVLIKDLLKFTDGLMAVIILMGMQVGQCGCGLQRCDWSHRKRNVRGGSRKRQARSPDLIAGICFKRPVQLRRLYPECLLYCIIDRNMLADELEILPDRIHPVSFPEIADCQPGLSIEERAGAVVIVVNGRAVVHVEQQVNRQQLLRAHDLKNAFRSTPDDRRLITHNDGRAQLGKTFTEPGRRVGQIVVQNQMSIFMENRFPAVVRLQIKNDIVFILGAQVKACDVHRLALKQWSIPAQLLLVF